MSKQPVRIRTEGAQRKRRILDPVKKMVAVAIQHHLITNPAARPDFMPMPEGVESVESRAISETETAIRVAMYDGPTRYFTVILRESMDKL